MSNASLERPSVTTEKDREVNRFPRSPALTVLLVFAGGIVTDAFYPLPLSDWFWLSGLAALFWCVACYQRRFAVSGCLLLILLFCMGGLRHHVFWFSHAPDHISRIFDNGLTADETSKLVRVTGVVSTMPQTEIADADEQYNPDEPQQRIMLVLACREIDTGQNQFPVSGKIQVSIYEPATPGQPVPFSLGDTVTACGKLTPISGKLNPQDFDFSRYYRKQQIEARLSVKFSEAVRVITPSARWSWNSIRHTLREQVKDNISQQTSGETQGLALALLLGDRSELRPETRQKFSRSGLVHFLAISGLHIGFFSLFVWSFCHVLNLPRKVAFGLLVLAIGFYLSIIEIRPPVLRAAFFCLLAVLGLINWRTITTVNLVCVTALVILIINPTDLFDPGTQLSFLAVAAILWTVQQDFYSKPFAQSWIPLRWRILAEDPVLQTPMHKVLIRLFRMFYSVFLITLMIWLLTAPLVMYYFNLLAPIGLLINTLIFPFLFLVLLLGYLLIFAGPILPWGTSLFGYCFNSSLQLLLSLVDFASQIPGGHYELPSPPAWWLICYYSLILLAVLPVKVNADIFSPAWLRKFRLSLVPCWVMGGLILPIINHAEPALKCTIIAVHHGAAILIESPAGPTVLYDAGSLASVDGTSETIRKTLLSQGIRRVDLLMLSHADKDHYNAATPLIKRGYVREMAFPRSFLDQRQAGTIELSELVENEGIPMTLVSKGDQLDLGAGVTLQVLHPAHRQTFEEDNASSLTVLISYQGRTILLTGDLEGDGLQALLAQEAPGAIDVLLSPHHGSLTANTRELAEWANPNHVIVSGGKPQTIGQLKQVYAPQARVYTTAFDGALTCSISQDGTVTVTPYRTQRRLLR